MQYFYPFFDPKTHEFAIYQCFDYELDEYPGAPLSRSGMFTDERAVIDFVNDRENQLPFIVQKAFRHFKLHYHNSYDGILD